MKLYTGAEIRKQFYACEGSDKIQYEMIFDGPLTISFGDIKVEFPNPLFSRAYQEYYSESILEQLDYRSKERMQSRITEYLFRYTTPVIDKEPLDDQVSLYTIYPDGRSGEFISAVPLTDAGVDSIKNSIMNQLVSGYVLLIYPNATHGYMRLPEPEEPYEN